MHAGQGTGLVRDAFHQAAVTGKDPGEVIDDGVTGTVELAGQQFFGQRHADRIGQPLPQRAGGGFHARGHAHFGVAGGFGMQLAEVLDVVDGEVVAAQVQQRVQQHRAMTIGEHEAVAVEPGGIGRAVLEVRRPQGHGNVGHAHRHAGVAGLRLLDGIHGQHTHGVGHAAGGVGLRKGGPAGADEGFGRAVQMHVIDLGHTVGPSCLGRGVVCVVGEGFAPVVRSVIQPVG